MKLKNFVKSLFLPGVVCCFLFSHIFAGSEDYSMMLNFEKTLKISRPSFNVDSVESDRYVVIGTCDPNKDLYLGDKVVKSNKSGIFSIEVELTSEKNIFNFEQDDQKQVVTIYKNQPLSSVAKKTGPNVLAECFSQAQPVENRVVTQDNSELRLACSAPSEASVTAIFDEQEYDLLPVDKTKQIAMFESVITVDDEKFETSYNNVGAVKYIINYDGEIKEVFSDGCVIFSDTDELSEQFVEVSKAKANVFELPSTDSKVLMTAKKGCVFETAQADEGLTWIKLKDFGYILRSDVCPAAEDVDINNVISNAYLNVHKDTEEFIFSGTCKPSFAAVFSSNKLTVRLYHTNGLKIDKDIYKNSDIIESVNIDQQKYHVDVVLNLSSNVKLQGYNIEYNENDTIVMLKKSQSVDNKNSKKPLKGFSVLLSAGHGGEDVGVCGILGGIGGVNEKDFALAYTLALKDKLESLGADVSLTRDDDSHFSLNNIMLKTEDEKPDFFISLHGDGVGNSLNPLNVSGYTVFYNNKNISENFAQMIERTLSEQDKIKSRGCQNVTLNVINNTFCPSALVQIGMLSHPDDVGNLISSEYIKKFVELMSKAIVDYFASI